MRRKAASKGDQVIGGRTITDTLKVGLIGCGGRGTGAISQALKADKQAALTAVADVDEGQILRCLTNLGRSSKIAGQVQVEDRKFVGIAGFQKVIESDVDLIILATPPGFRPQQLAACVNAGKHVYCEKPVATDAHGVRSVLRSVEEARQRGLCLMGGLSMRYNQIAQEMIAALEQGAIGPITAYHATFFHNDVKPMPPASSRPAGMSDTEWQIRNWYNFVWLSGDGLVEQAIHSIDRMSWAMNDEPPLCCIGTGGRIVPSADGNIYDHFSVMYEYASGVHAVVNSRQIDGCYNTVFDYIVGTEGTCVYGRGPYPIFQTNKKSKLLTPAQAVVSYAAGKSGTFADWMRNRVDSDMYQTQQNILLDAIRHNRAINDGKQLATTTLLAIMGRTAAYTGQRITWEQMLQSDERLVPEVLDWNGNLEITPRAQPGLAKSSLAPSGLARLG